jgi:hypothetical protein
MPSNDIPDWAQRLRDREARVLHTVAQFPALERVPHNLLGRISQLAVIVMLLALGTAIGSTVVWILLALPLTVVVILALLHGAEDAGRAPYDVA